MYELRDGDDVVVRYRSGGEERLEFCTFLVDADGELHLEYYLYRPDTVTDAIPLSHVERLRQVPPREQQVDLQGAVDEQAVVISVGDRPVITVRAKSGHLVVDFRAPYDDLGLPLSSLRHALARAEAKMRELGYHQESE